MKLHQLKGYIQNIFLVEYEHGLMLLDGACRADFETIKAHIEDTLHRPLSDLKVVLVTHMHPDHAGCAHYFRSQTACKIYSGPFSQHWYAGIPGSFAHFTDILLANWVAKKLGKKTRFTWYPRKLKPNVMLDEGECVPGFEDWKVIRTPGHTSMDISIENAKEKLIYVADLIVKIKGQLHPPFPVHYPEQYRNSLQKMHAFPEHKVLMAHVPAQKLSHDNLANLLSKAPIKAQNNKQAITSILRKMLGLSFLPANK